MQYQRYITNDTFSLIYAVEKKMTDIAEAADEAARHEMMRDLDKNTIVNFR